MATRADLQRLQRANRGAMTLATAALDTVWGSLDPTDPFTTQDALLLTVPAIADTYGALTALAAAEWYDDLRTRAGARGRFLSTPAPPVNPDIVRARTRFAARHLFADHASATHSFLDMALSGYVLQPGRDTIVTSAAADPARPHWARIPTRDHVCAFCLLYAARGPMRGTRIPPDANTYHGRCECVPAPIWSPADLPLGYDPEALRAKTDAAADAADTGSRSDVLSALRAQQDIA